MSFAPDLPYDNGLVDGMERRMVSRILLALVLLGSLAACGSPLRQTTSIPHPVTNQLSSITPISFQSRSNQIKIKLVTYVLRL